MRAETCFLCFKISKAATEWQYFCIIIFSQHCIFFSEKNHKKHLLFLFFLQIWDVMMLLITVNSIFQSAVTDNLYSQKSRAILIVLLQWKIEEKRKKKLWEKNIYLNILQIVFFCSVNESNTQSFLNCTQLTFTTFMIHQQIIHIRKDSKREDSVMIQITW